MRFISVFLTIIMVCFVLTGCNHQNNTTNQTNGKSYIDDPIMNPDHVKPPTVNSSANTMKSIFEMLQGEWEFEDETIKFYTEGDYYKYDDGAYNIKASIYSISIDEIGNIEIIVNSGSEQCRIECKFDDDNSVLIIDGNKYTKIVQTANQILQQSNAPAQTIIVFCKSFSL